MKIFYKTLVLIFIVCCSCSELVVRVKPEKIRAKKPADVESRKLNDQQIKDVTVKAEEEKSVETTTGKHKDVKTHKPSAAEEKIRKLITKIEEEQKATKAEQELMKEITGLIIEQTMTKIGYDFYEYFFLLWKPPEVKIKDYNILITERASSQWGSWVGVDVNSTEVWSGVLKPRAEEIEEAVKQAIEATKQYLNNYEQYQLETEDMKGSGI
jgi:hypothetical protein